jgi:hypothetical protein
LAVRFIPRACQAQANRVRFLKLFGNSAQQFHQRQIIEQPHIARPERGALNLPPAGISQKRRRARASALDAENERTLKCQSLRHARSLRARRRTAQANGLGFLLNLRYPNGMTDTTDINQALLDTLLELETAVANVNADPKPDLLALFGRLDELTAQLPKDTPRDLLHYLHKKSFQKARLYLQGADPEAGDCPH